MASSFTRFLDHTQRRTTVGKTPLDEWSARRRDLYLTTHNTQHSQQTNIHAPDGIRTHDLSRRAATDLHLRPRGHCDRHIQYYIHIFTHKNMYKCIHMLANTYLKTDRRIRTTTHTCPKAYYHNSHNWHSQSVSPHLNNQPLCVTNSYTAVRIKIKANRKKCDKLQGSPCNCVLSFNFHNTIADIME